jgi:hypothetical protein
MASTAAQAEALKWRLIHGESGTLNLAPAAGGVTKPAVPPVGAGPRASGGSSSSSGRLLDGTPPRPTRSSTTGSASGHEGARGSGRLDQQSAAEQDFEAELQLLRQVCVCVCGWWWWWCVCVCGLLTT